MANSNTVVPGYPTNLGNKIRFEVDHYGPTSYVQYALTPAGDIVNASDFGFGGFDNAGVTWSGYSNSGNFIVIIKPCLANDIAAGAAGKRFTVQWFPTATVFGASTGTEVVATTNLNAEYVRLVLDCV